MSEFKITTVQHRIKNESNVTIVSNELINDSKLSVDAKMIMIYLMTIPDNWIVIPEAVQTILNMSRGRCRLAFKNLVETGYIEKCYVRESNGRLSGSRYMVKPL